MSRESNQWVKLVMLVLFGSVLLGVLLYTVGPLIAHHARFR